MTELWLVGIGTGNPGHVTQEGIEALRAASAVLLPRKGSGKEDLAHLRQEILRRAGAEARVLPFDMPVRDETLPYLERVERWHDEIALRWTAALDAAPGGPVSGPVALLVWGDPGLYDSTLRIAARLTPAPRLRVVPGITALQALTSAHAIPFNTVNGAVDVTTGRRLRDHGWPAGAGTVIVGLVPEDAGSGWHVAGAVMYFAAGGLALLAVGWLWRKQTPLGWFILACGAVSLAALITGGVTGMRVPEPGTLERLMGYPITIGMAALGLVVAQRVRQELVARKRARVPAAGGNRT